MPPSLCIEKDRHLAALPACCSCSEKHRRKKKEGEEQTGQWLAWQAGWGRTRQGDGQGEEDNHAMLQHAELFGVLIALCGL